MKINITIDGETRQVNFTQPQAKVVRRLLDGQKIKIINEHWQSGGDLVWYEPDYDGSWGLEKVGYRAYNGAIEAIEKVFGKNIESLVSQWWAK